MAVDIFNGNAGPDDWSTPADWSLGAPPPTTDTAEINGPFPVNITPSDGLVTTGNLTLEDGASVTLSGTSELDVTGALTSEATSFDVTQIDLTGGVGGQPNLVLGGAMSGSLQIFATDGTVNFGSGFSLDAGAAINIVPGIGGQVAGDPGGNVLIKMLPVALGGSAMFAVDSNGSDVTGDIVNAAANTVTVDFADSTSEILHLDPTSVLVSNLEIGVAGSTALSITDIAPVCFCSGARLRTTRGEAAVERLAVGDLVVTASGEARPIVWIGRRRIDHPKAGHWPVRVKAGAFGDGLPARDLRLSPGHAVCVEALGEVLVPIEKLLNGSSIAREAVDEVTYWHVELESHDVLLAEGLPCESYMDAGNRAFFGREYGRLERVDPEHVAERLTRYARPFIDRGPIVDAIRERLLARAQAGGKAAPHHRAA